MYPRGLAVGGGVAPPLTYSFNSQVRLRRSDPHHTVCSVLTDFRISTAIRYEADKGSLLGDHRYH
jgi:hypothetical protein